MTNKPPVACPGCGHPFHSAGNCRAIEAGRCPCERNMAVHLTLPEITDEEIIDMLLPVEDLRRENRELRETIAEWQAIHGTLTGDVHSACQAEIVRLRAALFKIADDSAHADQYVRWAQEALGR